MPFINVLRKNNIITEIINYPKKQFYPTQCLERSIQLKRIKYRDSLIIIDDPLIPSAILNMKKILKIHGNKYIIRLKGDALRESSGLGKPILDFTIKGSNYIFHVAKYLEQKYRLIYPSKRHITIYNGVDLNLPIKDNYIDINEYLNLKQNFKIFILTVMNFEFIEKTKYINLLLPTIKRITNEYSALFVFIGDGKYLSGVKSIFNGQKGVVFLGRLPRDEVLKLMPYFDIFLYPSGLDILPNAVLEASASGIPVISSSVGGIPEIIVDKKTGFLMYRISEDSYKYLKLLIEDEDMRFKIARSGKEYVATKFNWNKVTNEFFKIIESEIGRIQ